MSVRKLLGIAALIASVPVAAAAEDVPGQRQASILTRALAYDRNMKERAGDAVVVGIVYRAGNSASEAAAADLYQAFRGLEKFAVHGLPFRTVRIAFDGAASLRNSIRSDGVDAVYVCPGLEPDVEAIAQVSQERKIISMGSREEHVTQALAIGVFVIAGKPTILLNLAASKREGAAFSSDLIRLAKVIN